jgi:Fe-S-cluster containining protein
MPDGNKNQAVSATTVNPPQWLTAYFHLRAHLASWKSDFHCYPDCTRPGCKNENLPVPVSLVDLLGVAWHHHDLVVAKYQSHYTLGLIQTEHHEWIRKVSLRLKKPCPFLENDLCGIYPVRPLACVLFPEYLVREGRFAAVAGQEQFQDFLCVHRPLPLSPQRAEVIGRLKNMWEREILLSNYYLFTYGHCYIDFNDQTKELLQAAGTFMDGESSEKSELRATIPNHLMERFFRERLAGCQTFDGLETKISRLDTPEGQVQFLNLLDDDLLVKKLMAEWHDQDLIFRFVKGKLKRTRRSLLPTEYSFY